MNAPLPDPLIAQILHHLSQSDDCVFLDTSKTGERETQSLLFENPVHILTCSADQGADPLLSAMHALLAEGYFLAGWFAYEFGYALEEVFQPYLRALGDTTLARIGVYREPQRFFHPSPTTPGVTHPPPPSEDQAAYQVSNLRLSRNEADYLQDIRRIKDYIAAGDTYQVNYTLKLLFDFAGSPEALYAVLRRNQPVSYGAYLSLGTERILSLSPELFFRKSGELIQARPMKGTSRRGPTLEADRQLATALCHDPKNQSENVMIVDLLRNDLGRLCQLGHVTTTSMFAVETYATLHQMTSTIDGRLRPEVELNEIFRALFPCGSVTGAPKIRTMEIIHELEQQPRGRGVYTGAIGYLSPNGDAVFNVPIRTVVINQGQGEMGIGSGIVYDSDPQAEWQECLLKGRFLTDPRPDFQLIETILWQRDAGFWLLEEHVARLCQSAEYFDYPVRPENLKLHLAELATAWREDSLRVRVLLHQDGRTTITATPCPRPKQLALPCPATPGQKLPAIRLSPRHTQSTDPFLYHKTTLRALYDTERQQALDDGIFEVVFTNERGEISEGSISTILLRQGEDFTTPPLASGLLPGVCRQYLLRRHPTILKEKVLFAADLQAAEAIYLCNSVRGIVEVGLA